MTIGWAHINSYDSVGTFSQTFLPLASGILPRQHWFMPIACGTVNAIEMQMANSGTPAALNVELEIWRLNVAGDKFAAVTSTDYDLISAGAIVPSSIPAGTAISSNFWLTIPITPFFAEDINSAFSTPHEAFAYNYAVKLFRTLANSDGQSNAQIGVIISNSLNSVYGTYANSGQRRNVGGVADAFQRADFKMALPVASLQINSRYIDSVNSKFTWPHSQIDPTQGLGAFGDTNSRRAQKFTAVGCFITRAAWDVAWDSTGFKAAYASIYTSNVASDLPETCIGTSQIVTAGAGGSLHSGDLNDLRVPVMFVFNNGSGVAVTSGAIYWAAFEAGSGLALADIISLPILSIAGARRASQTAGVGSWVATDNAHYLMNWWFTDGASVPPAPPAPSSNGAGYVYRSYPIGSYRSYPIGTFRSKPKG